MMTGLTKKTRGASLAAAILGLSCMFVTAQHVPETEMLPFKIAGKTYELQTFDEQGELERRSIIKVSPSSPAQDGAIELQIEILEFDRSDVAANGKIVRWVCSPTASQMLMPIFILSGDTFRRDSQLEVIGNPIIYPTDLSSETSLSDIELRIRIKKGALSLLGTRSRFRLTDRRITKQGSQDGEYTEITSNGGFRAYLAGIPVKRMRITIKERLDRSGEITRYEIRFANGGRSVLTLVEEQQSTAGDAPRPTVFSRLGVLDVPSSTHSAPLGSKTPLGTVLYQPLDATR